MDPNLLPEDLREDEAKEQKKSHRSANIWQSELHVPTAEKVDARPTAIQVAKNGSGFWSNIFSKKTVAPTPAVKLTEPKFDKPAERGFNLLDSPIESLLEPIDDKPSGWFGGLLGKPVSPIVSKPPKVKVVKEFSDKRIKTSNQKPVSYPSIETPSKSNDSGDGWLSILGGMFSSAQKRDETVKFARVDEVPKTAIKTEAMPNKYVRPIEAPITKVKFQEKIASRVEEHPKKEPIKNTKLKSRPLPQKDRGVEFGINLMPSDWQASEKAVFGSILPYLLLAVIVPLLLLSAGYLTVTVVDNITKAKLAEQTSVLSGINRSLGDFSVRTEDNNSFASKVKVIKSLNEQKSTWNKFFPLLEKYTLDGVYYNSLSADTSGVLVLPGVADNYQVLAKQLAVLRDATDLVKEVKISNAQILSEGRAGIVGVSFQLKLVLQDEVFKATK
jgi:hypothetical protein